MNEFLAQNWQWVVTLAFGFGTIIATVRINLNQVSDKIDRQTEHMDERFDALNQKDKEHDAKDRDHDAVIGDHSVRLARVETKVEHHTSLMKEIRDTVRDIHERVIGASR